MSTSWSADIFGQIRRSIEVANYCKSVDVAMTLYIAGKTDFLNVVTAQQSLINSENAMTQSNLNVALNLISLYKALGGG